MEENKDVNLMSFVGNYLVELIEHGTHESFVKEVKNFLNLSIGDDRLVDVKYSTYVNKNGHFMYSALIIYKGRSRC